MPFQPGNKEAAKGRKNKPWADALRMVAAELDNWPKDKEVVCPYPKHSLRFIAWHQFVKASDDISSAKEIGDRLDGKVPQAVVGDDDHPPVGGEVDVRQLSRLFVESTYREIVKLPPLPDKDSKP